LIHRPRKRVQIIDSDIAVVSSGAVDKVYRVQDEPPYILHLEFQAGHDSAVLPPRLKVYNGILEYRHDLLVLSVAVLLCPAADSPQLTGLIERRFSGQEPLSLFRYQVLRVWEMPAEQFLRGGLGTLALAPISAVREAEIRGVMAQMKARLDREPRRIRVAEVWAATYVLLGLRYTEAFAAALFEGVLGMEASATYRAIVAKGRVEGRAEGEAKGRVEEARRLLLRLGEKVLGPAEAVAQAAVEAISDVDRLEQLVEKVPQISNWQELLNLPQRRQRNSRGRRSRE
jgi:predicted transposase YdaD